MPSLSFFFLCEYLIVKKITFPHFHQAELLEAQNELRSKVEELIQTAGKIPLDASDPIAKEIARFMHNVDP